jgi:hypothetical protein
MYNNLLLLILLNFLLIKINSQVGVFEPVPPPPYNKSHIPYIGYLAGVQEGGLNLISQQQDGVCSSTNQHYQNVDPDWRDLVVEFEEFSYHLNLKVTVANPLNVSIAGNFEFLMDTGAERFIFGVNLASALNLKSGGVCKSKTANGR